jgi:hypothetical protein
VFVRAAHLLGTSAVLGAALFGVAGAAVHPWWIVAAASGVLLVVAELLRHPELWREVAGWATVAKLVLVGVGLAVSPAGPWLLSTAFVVAVVGAHAPREWRHRKLF